MIPPGLGPPPGHPPSQSVRVAARFGFAMHIQETGEPRQELVRLSANWKGVLACRPILNEAGRTATVVVAGVKSATPRP